MLLVDKSCFPSESDTRSSVGFLVNASSLNSALREFSSSPRADRLRVTRERERWLRQMRWLALSTSERSARPSQNVVFSTHGLSVIW